MRALRAGVVVDGCGRSAAETTAQFVRILPPRLRGPDTVDEPDV
jgi:hypothetical protein